MNDQVSYQVESVLGPKDAIRSLLLDMTVDLSPFRKLSDKTALLDEALKVGDGDVVSKVLLFLQKTLNQATLFSVLRNRNSAALQYLSILEKQKSYEEAANLCLEIGQPKFAFVILYSKSMKTEPQHQILALEKLLKNDLINIKGIDQEKELLKEQMLLLERQNVIASDASTIKKYEHKEFGQLHQIGQPAHPNSLIGSSLLATLQYCSRFYWASPENLITSPHGLRRAFSINERQFVWNAFIGRLLSGGDPISIVLVKVSNCSATLRLLNLNSLFEGFAWNSEDRGRIVSDQAHGCCLEAWLSPKPFRPTVASS